MATFNLTINPKLYRVEADPQMPLLWVLREKLRLTGTKFGCGMGLCGACTVHLGDRAHRSCSLPVSAVGRQAVTTIEGLSPAGTHPLQRAWEAINVPQCGYCQAGQIMTAAALLKRVPHPTPEQVRAEMNNNLCRCGTYPQLAEAILEASRPTRTQP